MHTHGSHIEALSVLLIAMFRLPELLECLLVTEVIGVHLDRPLNRLSAAS